MNAASGMHHGLEHPFVNAASLILNLVTADAKRSCIREKLLSRAGSSVEQNGRERGHADRERNSDQQAGFDDYGFFVGEHGKAMLFTGLGSRRTRSLQLANG
jgi:hypothetical protein